MESPTYILWDWNGTLLDDTAAAVGALNLMLGRRGLPSVTLTHYRENFAFPVRKFYAEVGFRLEDEDWDALAREYHDSYAAQPRALAADAISALEMVRAAGCRQSIISALRQDLLREEVARFGVSDFFEETAGTDNLDGCSKLERARTLVARIRERHAGRMVIIGDAFHDKEVADCLGIGCVLYGGGSHSAARLAAVAPTAPTLCDAFRLALKIRSF